jgi:hypothetical protein
VLRLLLLLLFRKRSNINYELIIKNYEFEGTIPSVRNFFVWGIMKDDNVIQKKSFDFAIRIVNVYKFLQSEKKEYVLSKQLL